MTRNMIRLVFTLLFVGLCAAGKSFQASAANTAVLSVGEGRIQLIGDGTTPYPPLCPTSPYCRVTGVTLVADGTTPYPPLCPKGMLCSSR